MAAPPGPLGAKSSGDRARSGPPARLPARSMPNIPRQRIQFIGSSSLAGARAALVSRAAWRRAREIASSITCLELTVEPRYFDEYTAALFLPHTDPSLFPSC